MESRRLAQAVILVAIVGLGGFAIFKLMDGWSSWVVLGFLVVGLYGGALAVDDTRHTRRGRTFIRHWDDRS